MSKTLDIIVKRELKNRNIDLRDVHKLDVAEIIDIETSISTMFFDRRGVKY